MLRFSYAIKARMLFEAGFLSEVAFVNVMRLNKMRNAFVHKLLIEEKDLDLRIASEDSQNERLEIDIRTRLQREDLEESRRLPFHLFTFALLGLWDLDRLYHARFGSHPLTDKALDKDELLETDGVI